MTNYNDRYGFDLLSIFMIFISLILNVFPITRIFSFILLILSFYRAFCKMYYKRRQEYNVFYTYCNKFLALFKKSLPANIPNFHFGNLYPLVESAKNSLNEKRNYKITKCPKCHQKLRLPRGKGKIVVTCRRCSNKFDFKT